MSRKIKKFPKPVQPAFIKPRRPIGVLIICTILPIVYGFVPLLKMLIFGLFSKDIVLFPDFYFSIIQIGRILIAASFIVICFLAMKAVSKARVSLVYLCVIRFGIFGIFPPLFLLIASNPPTNIAKVFLSDFKVSLIFLIITLWYFSRKKTRAFYEISK